jgi:hypothetical protein
MNRFIIVPSRLHRYVHCILHGVYSAFRDAPPSPACKKSSKKLPNIRPGEGTGFGAAASSMVSERTSTLGSGGCRTVDGSSELHAEPEAQCWQWHLCKCPWRNLRRTQQGFRCCGTLERTDCVHSGGGSGNIRLFRGRCPRRALAFFPVALLVSM